MSRHTVAATLAALALVSILTPAVASARNFSPVRLAIGSSNGTPTNHPPFGGPHFHPYPNYSNGFVSPFGLGTGGLGGSSNCPTAICGHPHPQVR